MAVFTSLTAALRHHVATLALSGVLALLVAYYVVGYLPQRRHDLEQRYFRVLARVGYNIREQLQVYRKINEGVASVFSVRGFPHDTLFAPEGNPMLLQLPNSQNQVRNRWHQLKPYCADLQFDNITEQAALATAVTYRPTDQALVFRQRLWKPRRLDNATRRYPAAPDSTTLVVSTFALANRFVQPLIRQESFQQFYVADFRGRLFYSNLAHGRLSIPLPSEAKQDSSGWQTRNLVINGQPCVLFILPLRLGTDSTQVWYLAGTVPQQEFRSAQHSLPVGLQELLFGGLLLGLLSLPFLKISLLNEHERLNYGDIIQCAVALLLGSGLLTLTLVAELTRRYPETNELNEQLNDLSTRVEERLQHELRTLNSSLAHFCQECTLPSRPGPHTAPLANRIAQRVVIRQPVSGVQRPLARNDMVMRISAQGLVISYVLDPTKAWPLLYSPDLQNRGYFRQARRQAWMSLPDLFPTDARWRSVLAWPLPESSGVQARRMSLLYPSAADTSARQFVLDGIISYRQAAKTTALVQPAATADSALCALFTQHLHTFEHPVLPPGFAFCLIDQHGEILFHSDAQLGLSENLLEDSNSPKLKAAMLALEPTVLSATYQGHEHRLHVRPLASLGLTLVTLADLRVPRAQHSQAYALATAILTGLWLLWMSGGLMLRLLRPRRRVQVLPRYRFAALWPRRQRGPLYLALAVLVGLVLLLLLWIIPKLPLGTRLLLILLLPLMLYPLTRFLLHRPGKVMPHETDGEAPTTPRLLDKDQRLTRNPWQQIVAATILLLFLNVLCLYHLAPAQAANPLDWLQQQPWMWALFLQLMLGLGFGGVLWARGYVRRLRPLAPPPPPPPGQPVRSRQRLARLGTLIRRLYQHYRYTYAALLLAWVSAAGIVPALVCYQTSYQLVRLLHVREAHLRLIRQLREATNPATGQGLTAPLATKVTWPNSYVRFFFGTDATQIADTSRVRQLMATTPFDDFIRPFYPGSTGQLHTLLVPDYFVPLSFHPRLDEANSWRWHADKDTMRLYSRVVPVTTAGNQYLVSSLAEPLFSADWWRGRGYVPGAAFPTLIALGLLFWLLYYLVRKLFAPMLLSQPPNRTLRGLPVHDCQSGAVYHYVFSPAGWQLAQVLAYFRPHARTVTFDCRTVMNNTDWEQALALAPPTSLLDRATQRTRQFLKLPVAPRPDTIVLEHFEFQTEQPAVTQRKIELLNWLALRTSFSVIILARVHPRAFTDCGHPLEKDCHEPDHRAMRQTGNNLLDTLRHFQVQHIPLLFEEAVDLQANGSSAAAGPTHHEQLLPQRFLDRECRNLDFLHHMRPSLESTLLHLHQIGYCIERDIATLTIKRMAMLYFRSLWRALSPHEQFLLFDLAQDGIINTNNWPVLDSLVRKGYLIVGNDDRLRIVSEGFRAYILSAVPRQQALRFEEKERNQGMWSKFSFPLLLLLASAAVFLAATQGETLSVAQQYLTLLTGLVPLLVRLFSSGTLVADRSTASAPPDASATS